MIIETARPERLSPDHVEDLLLHHWMLDSAAAHQLANGVNEYGRQDIYDFSNLVDDDPEAVLARDEHRLEITQILNGQSDKKMIVVGPCSLEADTDYNELFDYIAELQEDNEDSLVVLRANGSKPRTSGGWGGLMRDTDSDGQDSLIDVYKEAFGRKIPTVTEITDRDDFLQLAPFLSGVWLGARDMTSTNLHATMSATRMGVLIKNPLDGSVAAIENVIQAIGKGTETDVYKTENIKGNEGSGVNFGILGYTYRTGKYPKVTMIKVGHGNPNTGIIARGFNIDSSKYNGMDPEIESQQRVQEVVGYLAQICMLAERLNKKVIIDGQHDVPAMLNIEKTDEDRFLRVMDIILGEAESGVIPFAKRIVGVIAEMSPTRGRTDVNLPLYIAKNNRALDKLIKRIVSLGKVDPQSS